MKEGTTYRADIDGLRALAVLSVLFFHLQVLGFSGGYVGVDIFFVISGYLITRYVHSEVTAQTFSLRSFYLRRLRRLAPALLLFSIPVTIAAWALLYPEDMRSFAASLGLQFVALQNFFLLADGEYFRGSDTKPLLHTWSLAIEEQFYLVWPLLLLSTRRLGFKWRVLLLSALLVCSFLLNLAMFSVSPKASFFLLPPRAWELGVGGLVALIEHENLFARWSSRGWRTISGVVGISAILASVVCFTSDTPFPGRAALLPVFGTALVVIAGIGGRNPVGKVLSLPGVVRLGLISYPLYLWHWPLIAFAHYAHLDTTTPLAIVVILVVSIGLAEASYRFIETPIRTRRWLPTPRALVGVSAATAAALIAFAAHSYATEGAGYRFPPMARALLTAPFRARSERCGFVFRALHPRAQVCELRTDATAVRRVVLWGNSHADMWSGLMTELATERRAAVYLNTRNCRATRDSEFCNAHVQDAILAFISVEKVTDVVLASSWYGAYEIKDDVFEAELSALLGKLSEMGVRTWLVIDIPTGDELSPIKAFERAPSNPQLGRIAFSDFVVRKHREEGLFDRLSRAHSNVRVIDSSIGLCNGVWCIAGTGETVWYRDSSHLSDDGARTAANQFLAVFR